MSSGFRTPAAVRFEHDFTPLGADVEKAIVSAQIAAGERDVGKLTNHIFYIAHPSLKGTRLGKGQEALMAEWRRIRDNLVLPLLATSTPVPLLRLKDVTLGNGDRISLFQPSHGRYRGYLSRPFEGRVATLTVTGWIEVVQSGHRRAYSTADQKVLGPLKVRALAVPGDGVSSSIGRDVSVGSTGVFRAEMQIGAPKPTRLVQIHVELKGTTKVSARVVLELIDLQGFLTIVDAEERSSSLSHLDFLASVRKVFQGGPGHELERLFDLVLYRNRKVPVLFNPKTGASLLAPYAKGLWADGEVVDIGHVLCGIEGAPLQDPGRGQSLDASVKDMAVSVLDAPTRQRLVTWAGDLGNALHKYVKAFVAVVDAGEPLDLATYFAEEAARADLIGDIDGINIGAVYQPRRSLADNLNTYYGRQSRRRYHRFIEVSTSASGARLFPLQAGSSPPRLAPAARRHIAEQVLAFQSALSITTGFTASLPPSKRRLYDDIVRRDSPEMETVVDYFVGFLENGLAREPR